MSQRLCSAGHVISPDREFCERDNGAAVSDEYGNPITSPVDEIMTDETNEAPVEEATEEVAEATEEATETTDESPKEGEDSSDSSDSNEAGAEEAQAEETTEASAEEAG